MKTTEKEQIEQFRELINKRIEQDPVTQRSIVILQGSEIYELLNLFARIVLPDQEKVKKGLECCLSIEDGCCTKCPYHYSCDSNSLSVKEGLLKDAITLLNTLKC